MHSSILLTLVGMIAFAAPAFAAQTRLENSRLSPRAVQKRTLDPCTSNTKGVCPSSLNCSATKISKAIQAAECSHNTRTSGKQTFAVFVTDHQYDKVQGAPYGTCSAYTCTAPTTAQMTDANADCWTFFWQGAGQSSGVGTGCIKDPSTGECGCENSDGTFIPGGTDCK